MIQILIVDDNVHKQSHIKKLILENHSIAEKDIIIANCTKNARKILYSEYFDLMILDLVLPIEEGSECDPINGVNFLNEIQISPSIKPPIHIVGLSGFKDKVIEYNDSFKMKLWNLIDYQSDSSGWQDSLNSIIYHLVKTRQTFLNSSIENKLGVLFAQLEDMSYPNTFLGHDWKSICNHLVKIIERSLDVSSQFANGDKAKNINRKNIVISSEYDFQNLIHLTLRPWIPSLEPENVAIVFDGNSKNADFSINQNSIIIEAKYIDNTGKKNDTLKTIEGLKNFYSTNSNVKSLIFILLVENSVEIDPHKIESQYSQLLTEPIILVKVISNKIPIVKV